MPNIGGKGFPSVPTRYESSKKRYMNSTAESRNKQINRNEDKEDKERKRSPLRSPRLCEEDYPPNNLHLKIEIKREYYPQKYDDPAQAQPIENETYFQTLPQDEFGDSYEHKPRPPSGSSSSKKLGKERRVTPKSSDKNKEYSEKAEFGKEHKLCNMKLSVKEREINRLKGIIDNISKPLEAKRFTYERGQSKRFDDLQRQVNILEDKLFKAKSYLEKEQEKTERLTHQNQEKEDKLTDMRLKCMRFDDLQRQVNVFADQLFKAKSNLEKEQEKTERLTHQNQEKEDKLTDMRSKYMRLEKVINEFKQMHEISAEGEKKIVEQQTELEKMCTIMEKFKKDNDSLSENNNKLEDRIRKLQAKLDHLERFGETHQPCVEIQDGQSRYIKELVCEVESQDNNFLLLQNEYDNLNCSYSTMKAEMAKVKHHLQTELDAKTEEVNKLTRQQIRLEEFRTKYYIVKSDNKKVWENCSDLKRKLEDKVNELENVNSKLNRAESLSLEVKILQREKAYVEEQNSELTRALQAKGIEMESLIKHRERSEKQIRNLNNEICDIQNSKRHTVNESLQQLLTENSSLKSTLEHRTLEIENLSKECEKQRRTREKGEHEMTELEQMVQKNKNEVEELNTRLEEFSKKCSALHRDNEEAHAKISALTDALYEKKRDVESLTNQLERSETHMSVLNSRIDELHRMNTEAVDKSKSIFQNENASLKSAYDQATFKYKDLSKELTNVKQDKKNAEYQIRSLSDALYHKDKELESVQDKLTRAENKVSILLKDIEDIQESKRLADEKLKGLQTENSSLKSALSKATNEIEDLLNKGTNQQKYKTDAEHKTSTFMNVLKEKETEIEALREQLARAEKNVSILSQDIKDIQASKRQVAEEKLKDLQTENASLKSALSKATNEIEDLLNKGTNLQKYKTDAEHKTSTLKNAMKEKESEIEALREQLARAEKNVSILSQDIKDIQASKRQVAEEKLQDLQTENASLKSALSKATNEIEDLLNKGTNLQKYKTDAEHKTSTLMNALKEKETQIEALSKQLARSEENVSILSKDIKNIKESKRQVADEKLQDLQTENDSLKLTLAEATTENDDLWNKCTNLQKYKSDTELEIGTLLNTIEEKETEIKTLHKHLARSEKHVSNLSKDIKDIEGSKRQAADEKVQGLKTENASLKSALAEATNEIDALRNKCTNLQKYKTDTEHTINTMINAAKEKETESETINRQLTRENNELSKDISNLKKDKENAENQRQSFSKALKEKEKEIEIMRNDIARYTEKISTLTKNVEDIKGSKNQAADENIKGLQKKIRSLESDFRSATADMNDLSYKYKCLQKDKESAEYTINKLSNTVQEKEKEIDSLIEDLAKANVDSEEYISSAYSIQKLKDENTSLKSELSQLSHETEKKVSALTKEIKSLQKSKGTSSEEYNARKLNDENEFLKAQLDRTSRSYEQLKKDYNEVKREKDHALNRLSSVAGEKLRNNNPGIADLSDENRPINLGEKFSQLYDDQWTDAIEHLEEMGYSETDGIRCLLDILKAVFDECVKLSDIHFNQLKELTGTSHLPSDQLKKLKDLRKATAIHSVAKTKHLVNDYMSKTFSKEKAACQTYIDRSIELCWLMSVQDPPVVIDFIAVHGQAIDDKILRKFTKTGSKIDFLVWPVIRLHKNGPLLQKGVVQPI